jgi:multiple sugar transport system substrate-binding protein
MIMNTSRMKQIIMLLSVSSIVVSGCGSGETAIEKVNEPSNPDPVTVKLSRNSTYVLEDLEKALDATLAKKHPHIKLEWVLAEGGATLEGQITAGQQPDIIMGGSSTITLLKQLGLHYDMAALAQKHKFDLSQIEPNLLELIRIKSDDGKKLYALPFANGFNLMFYNKDIFDKFGISYPQDNMTWDQVMQIAKTMTRIDNGTQYYGIGFAGNKFTPFNAQYGLQFVEQKTGKAGINNDGWKKVFELAKNFYDAGAAKSADIISKPQDVFIKNGNLAMWVGNNATRKMGEMNWEMVSMPSPAEFPGIGGASPFNIVAIAETSKNKDAAFDVLMTLLSDEVQTVIARTGMPSPLKADKYKQEFGKDVPELKGKNTEAIFKNKPAPVRDDHEYDPIVTKPLVEAMNAVLKDEKDINTALREAEEKANKAIEAEMTKK